MWVVRRQRVKVSCSPSLRDGQTDFILHAIPLNLCTQPSVTVKRRASEQTSSGRCDVSRTGKQLHYHVTIWRRHSPIPKPTARRGWRFTKIDAWSRARAWRRTNISVCSNSAFVTVLTKARAPTVHRRQYKSPLRHDPQPALSTLPPSPSVGMSSRTVTTSWLSVLRGRGARWFLLKMRQSFFFSPVQETLQVSFRLVYFSRDVFPKLLNLLAPE